MRLLDHERKMLSAAVIKGRIEGFNNAINSVVSSLRDYPHAGGDLRIMAEVDRLIARQKAEIELLRRERDLRMAIDRLRDLQEQVRDDGVTTVDNVSGYWMLDRADLYLCRQLPTGEEWEAVRGKQ